MSGGASGHGGARPGAGRRKGDGCKWGEPTRVMRIPASRLEAVSDFLTHAVLRPADAPAAPCSCRCSATPSAPAFHRRRTTTSRTTSTSMPTDPPQGGDLPPARARSSMVGAGIHDGDLLVSIAHRWSPPMTPRRHRRPRGRADRQAPLAPEWLPCGYWPRTAYAPLEVGPDQELVIWGVVTNVIHGLL